MVGQLIGLRRTIQRHSPAWKRRLGMTLGLLAATVTWLAVIVPAPGARADALSLCLGVWLLGWVIGPVLGNGASVLRPGYFALLPIRPLRLSGGLVVSAYAGTGTLVTLIASGAVVLLAVQHGEPVRIVVAVSAALLFVILVVSLSRVLYALVGSAMRTRVGLQIAAVSYGALVAVVTFGWLMIIPLIGLMPDFLARGFTSDTIRAVFQSAPSGWPVLAVQHAGGPHATAAATVLGGLMLAAVLAVTGAVWVLIPRARQHRARRLRMPLGARHPWRLLPASPLAAVVGRELRTWTRDPWQRLEVWLSIWFGLFVALIAVLAGRPAFTAFAGVGLAVMVTLRGTNLYGHDGTALWQLVTAASPMTIRADVRGRQLALAVVFGLPAVILTVVMGVATGAWSYTAVALAGVTALTVAGTGVAVLASVIWPTPGADPHLRVNASDVGENPVVYRVATWVTFALVSPTVGLGVVVALAPQWLPGCAPWALGALASVNALVVSCALGAKAAEHLGDRMPETLTRLRHTAQPLRMAELWDAAVNGIRGPASIA